MIKTGNGDPIRNHESTVVTKKKMMQFLIFFFLIGFRLFAAQFSSKNM